MGGTCFPLARSERGALAFVHAGLGWLSPAPHQTRCLLRPTSTGLTHVSCIRSCPATVQGISPPLTRELAGLQARAALPLTVFAAASDPLAPPRPPRSLR